MRLLAIRILLAMLCTICLFLVATRPTAAQIAPATCREIISALPAISDSERCGPTYSGQACYVKSGVEVTPEELALRFFEAGKRVAIAELETITTDASGAAMLVAKREESSNDVRILAIGSMVNTFGDGGTVIDLEADSPALVCEQSPAALVIQAEGRSPNLSNTVEVNDVVIELGSTAVVALNDLLADGNPRTQDDKKSFCIGFRSKCEYGDDDCGPDVRLMEGPNCRGGETHKQIEPGLYRVTLHGSGQVRAAAVDLGVVSRAVEVDSEPSLVELTNAIPKVRDEDRGVFWQSLEPKDIDGSLIYTFTWPGLQEGGEGFELLVDAVDEAARVDRITVELLNHKQCEDGETPDVMRISNIEGTVRVRTEISPTVVTSIEPGDWVRVRLCNGDPVEMSEPLSNDVVAESTLVAFLTEDALPQVNAPIVATRTVDSGAPTLTLQIDARVGISQANGDGIDSVEFVLSATDRERPIVKHIDYEAPYCLFGEKEGVCRSWDIVKSNRRWPNGEQINVGTAYSVRVRANGQNGQLTEEVFDLPVGPFATVKPGADLLRKPRRNSEVIKEFSGDEVVTLLCKADTRAIWYRVSEADNQGYLPASFLKLNRPEGIPACTELNRAGW